jgi:hypothetical protein
VNTPLIKRGYNIGLVIARVRETVAGIHSGRLPAPVLPGQRPAMLRWTPSYIQGVKPKDVPNSKAYTAVSIARILEMTRTNGRGNAKASLPVEIALHLLECRELDVISEGCLNILCDGDYSLQQLLRMYPRKSLRDARAEHVASLSRSKKFSYAGRSR